MATFRRPTKSQGMPGCIVVFFAVLTLPFLAFFGYQGWHDWRIHTAWVETTCTVTGSRVVESSGDDGATYRPEVDFHFDLDGRRVTTRGFDGWNSSSSGYEGKAEAAARFVPGGQYPCWYDPDDPEDAVVVKEVSLAYLALLLPLGVLAFVTTVWARSRRRRRLLAEVPGADAQSWLPPIASKPGSRLAYALAPEMGEGCAFGGALFVALFWNGITAVPVWHVVQGFRRGETEWFLAVFISIFALIGLGLLVWAVRRLLVLVGIGRTIVEVNALEVAPGQEFEIDLLQRGSMHLNLFDVRLVCEEGATYRQGTSSTTDRRRVHDDLLERREDLRVDRWRPLRLTLRAQVPADAMHSFKASRNSIGWKIVVKGDVEGWPDFERAFPIVVAPQRPVTGRYS